MNRADWYTLGIVAVLAGLWFLARRRWQATQAHLRAEGRAELRAELASMASASATGGAVHVHGVGAPGLPDSDRYDILSAARLIIAAHERTRTDDDHNGTSDYDKYLASGAGLDELSVGTGRGNAALGSGVVRDSARYRTVASVRHPRAVAAGVADDGGSRAVHPSSPVIEDEAS